MTTAIPQDAPQRDASTAITLRKASKDDQAQLEALVRQTPMNGSMTLYYERSPNFFAILERQGERFKSYVAEVQGQIIASVSFAERLELWQERPVQVIHGSDLRIHPSYRGRKLARALIDLYVAETRRPGIHHASCEILQGNEASIGSLKTASDRLQTELSTTAHLFQLLPLRSYRISSHYKYRQASSSDLASIQELLQEFTRQYEGSPLFDQSYMQHFCQFADFNLESFWLAELNGKPVALLAEWDQKAVRDLIVERYQPLTGWLVQLGRWVAPVLGIRRPPKAGEALPYMYFRFPILKPEDGVALRQLIRHRLNALRKQRRHLFVMINFAANDWRQKLLSGVPRLKSTALVYKSQVPTKAQNPVSNKAHYVDFSIC